MIKVAKFGGSSLANSTQIKKVGEIIKQDPNKKIIVVSAPGKRNDADFKMTDLLIELGNRLKNNESYEQIVQTLEVRFSEIINELDLSEQLLNDIKNELHNIIINNDSYTMKLEALKSVGENSSAKIVSAYLLSLGLESSYVSPQDACIIVSDNPGNAELLPSSMKKLYDLRKRKGLLVIPGFFGYTEEGSIITFSRGGSDITGSIVAAGVKADLYENYTDVDSVYTVNPNIVNDPKKIEKLTYREMRELSYAGFSVFHDEALIPAFEAEIPVHIKNTNNPEAKGTKIVSNKKPEENCVIGIASDTGFCSLYVSKFLMNREIGFGRRLLRILEDEKISFEHMPSGIDDITIIMREEQLKNGTEERIIKRIKDELHVDEISMERGLAIIMVVGEGMNSTVGMAQTATSALANAKINIRMINQGSSEVSMMFGIRAKQMELAIRSLYNSFFSK